jgi:hypothetical protein
MEYTDVYNIPCLGEEDYPAVALHMKNLALQIEEQLAAQQAQLDEFLDLGSLIWTGPGGGFFVPTGHEYRVSMSAAPTGGANLPYTASVQAIPPIAGWYHIGTFARITSAGFAAVGKRTLTIRAGTVGYGPTFADIPEAGNIELNSANSTIITSDTEDFDDLWTSMTVYWDGSGYAPIVVGVFNGDVVPVSVAVTPAPKLWLYYMGPANDIRQV